MLSSDTLFHFTDSAEKLVSILRNEFYPRYSLEKIRLHGEGIELAFPMVCFCDIPLSQIKNHIETYGSYGIGMSKQWANEKGLNPVLYLRPGTSLAQRIYAMFEQVQRGEQLSENSLFVGLRKELIDFLRYIKLYEGDLVRKDKLVRNVRFYDEREWRYVPALDKTDLGKSLLIKDQYVNAVTKAHADTQIENAKLSFEPKDIRYLIIREDKEIAAMIKALRDIKHKYTQETIEILTSRIMTCEQIMRDV